MRTATFLSLCALLAGIITVFLQAAIAFLGLNPPFIDSFIFEAIKFVLIVPVVVFALNPLNQKLRSWRKQHGRDVEIEEKYETESGFISITQKDK